MNRRTFLWILGGTAVACQLGCDRTTTSPTGTDPDAPSGTPPDAAPEIGVDACAQATVSMHDMNAQALYLDGSYGPFANVVTVASVIAGTTVTLDFWHGHNGVLHRFTLEPDHFAALERGERVMLGTTIVDDHSHTLFVDPVDEAYRVPGAPDVAVPLGHC